MKKEKSREPQRHFETPNAEARQHDVYLIEEVDGIKRARNITQLPLDYYLAHRLITEKQHRAGIQFFYLWYYGAEKNFMTSGLFGPNPHEKGTKPNYETHAEAQEAYYAALDAIGEVEKRIMRWKIKKLCHDVCCLCNFAAVVMLFGKNRKMQRLRGGLDDLVRHFGIR